MSVVGPIAAKKLQGRECSEGPDRTHALQKTASSFDQVVHAGEHQPFAERDVMESLRNPKSADSSFWFDAGVFDDWPPLLNLGLLQSAQRFRRLLLAGENLLSEFSKSRTNWRLG